MFKDPLFVIKNFIIEIYEIMKTIFLQKNRLTISNVIS